MLSLSMRPFSVGNEGSIYKPNAVEKSEKVRSRKISKVSETASCNDVPVLRRAAMDYLARREHSFYELTQKLNKKSPESDSDLLVEVLDTLKADNLQSDERFTESYVRYRKSRGFAYQHIRADLAGRRVSETIIGKYLIKTGNSFARQSGSSSNFLQITNKQIMYNFFIRTALIEISHCF